MKYKQEVKRMKTNRSVKQTAPEYKTFQKSNNKLYMTGPEGNSEFCLL